MSLLSLNFYARSIHSDNVLAGWWSDLATGHLITPKITIGIDGEKQIAAWNRNAGELLALVHSEISEAWEASFFNIYDSHLPKFKGEGVEIGDSMIRLFDVAGAYGFNLQEYSSSSIVMTTEESAIFDCTTGQIPEAYCACNAFVSRALEGFRKMKYSVAERNINLAIWALISLASNNHRSSDSKINVWHMIDQKRAYNKRREDHKIENRLKDGGKKI